MLTHRAEIVEEIDRRRFALNQSLLRVYNAYRLLVGLALVLVFLQSFMGSELGEFAPTLFLRAGLAYCVFNLVTVLALQLIPRRRFHPQRIAIALVLTDVLWLTLLMYASGGVGSGIGLLVLIAVATGAILVTGRTTLLLAAIASIAVLYQEFYISLSAPELHDDYFQAGVLGGLFFAAAIGLQHLSQRIRDNDLRALVQAAELADLERVNRQIIQRMRTGIVVVDANDRVRMANQSARALLGRPADEDLDPLPDVLLAHLAAWRRDTDLRLAPFQVRPDTPELRVNFAPVRINEPTGDVTLFLEDTGEVQQQAQQLKLAALGRLSASIAHEIRNPLGAISHAAQLLRESEQLEPGDQRLTDIIHSHCQRMNGVIENVLETSRRRPPTPVRLVLSEHLAKFKESFEQTTQDATIDVRLDPPDTQVRMDRSQLDQVLTNLVTNALRHGRRADGAALVRLEGGIDRRTERPYLSVVDFGPGVADDQADHLFEPFFTTSRSGTGLGLYLSRELCEANLARLVYHPHAEGGACFRIIFTHPDRIIA